MKPRAFTLTELLVVIAILAVLAALLFPVFSKSKQRAKHTACQTHLRQFAMAFVLYRNDNDGKGFVWSSYDGKGNRYPFNSYEPMGSYFKGDRTVWCPEQSPDPMVARDFYHYQTWSEVMGDPKHTVIHRPFAPDAGNVLAFCGNHTTTSDPRPVYAPYLRVGPYPFVREDLSMGLADNRATTVMFYKNSQWTEVPVGGSYNVFRFPGVPWPPNLEQ